ncbi:hypothetical protein DFH06DRAFT_1134484 [Mycena polygramma]|nr:hypothetical protein DFH06DRAFT_1134484 [Mycena polygramma]
MSAFITCNIIPSSSCEPVLRERHQSLRERCGFTEFISFAPAFPNIPAKGHLGPTAGNLPRRKRSSAAPLALPALAPAPRGVTVDMAFGPDVPLNRVAFLWDLDGAPSQCGLTWERTGKVLAALPRLSSL